MLIQGRGYGSAIPVLLTAGPQAAPKERAWVLRHCWPEQGLTLLLGGM